MPFRVMGVLADILPPIKILVQGVVSNSKLTGMSS